jgi:hypothetical protein
MMSTCFSSFSSCMISITSCFKDSTSLAQLAIISAGTRRCRMLSWSELCLITAFNSFRSPSPTRVTELEEAQLSFS